MVPHMQASGSLAPIKNKVNSLTLTPLSNIPLIRRDDNLADIFVNSLQESNISIQDNDILVIHEYEFPNNKTVYLLRMHDRQSNIVTLKVCNGEMEYITPHE